MNSTSDTTKKVFDVAGPGQSTPSTTSRPIIVTNRPILKDPMMVEEDSASTETPETPSAPSKPSRELKLQPLSDDQEDDGIASSVAADEKPPSAEEESGEKVAVTTSTSKAANETPIQKPAADSPLKDTGSSNSSPDEPDPQPSTTSSSPASQDPEAAAKADTEHEAAIQKLVEGQQYFLPINSVEKRRTKHFIMLGILLILVLGAAWVDVALDAGLIHIQGVNAMTHFFSS